MNQINLQAIIQDYKVIKSESELDEYVIFLKERSEKDIKDIIETKNAIAISLSNAVLDDYE